MPRHGDWKAGFACPDPPTLPGQERQQRLEEGFAEFWGWWNGSGARTLRRGELRRLQISANGVTRWFRDGPTVVLLEGLGAHLMEEMPKPEPPKPRVQTEAQIPESIQPQLKLTNTTWMKS